MLIGHVPVGHVSYIDTSTTGLKGMARPSMVNLSFIRSDELQVDVKYLQ